MIQYSVEPFSQTTTVGSVGKNGDVNVTVSATRRVHIESTIISGNGVVNNVVWFQDLQYKNVQNFLNNASIQVGEILQCPTFDFVNPIPIHLERASNYIWHDVVDAQWCFRCL